jgi:6-pyruvoyl-tetrahydropterin synthase
MTSAALRAELLLKFEFTASHSLASYEKPHPHRWKLECAVTGDPGIGGMIVDLVKLRTRLEQELRSLRDTFLNENPVLDAPARQAPTCETLSSFFYRSLERILHDEFTQENTTIRAASVMVAICEMDGTEMGAVRVALR